ncbi:39S ribosomal protein L50, mitochondrial [Lutzomyia longipalpis]|uniref:39S ribosomal protein L50, mitochondrial n=1 Tax=Lutzomyia longipalpis TaxID=7200 RepID=UPI0024846E15|nr:39S ribosomal protein L50, mitochondrial [Lutzomyia longipalpis]
MANITQHFVFWKTCNYVSSLIKTRGFSITAVAYKKNKKPAPEIGGQRIDSAYQSLASRGFLRSYEPYEPPNDVSATIQQLAATAQYDATTGFPTLGDKFNFLEECRKIFKRAVPNSFLHDLLTIEDVIEFYQTPMKTTLPIDDTLKEADLPVNLHIQSDYVRYHPEEDTMFGGISAFPRSSTLVTGVKYRKKYRGHVAKTSWP